jgi:PleD family two-component response regulator
MNSELVKVLLIYRDPERRKERISVLKEHGHKVFPALDLQQARSRCKPDAFELIVVNSDWQLELALELGDSITITGSINGRRNCPTTATGLHGSGHSRTAA